MLIIIIIIIIINNNNNNNLISYENMFAFGKVLYIRSLNIKMTSDKCDYKSSD